MKSTAVLNHLAETREGSGPSVLDVARAAGEDTSTAALAERFGISRRQVYRVFDPLVEAGLVSNEGGFSVNSAGERLFDTYASAVEILGADGVATLVTSEHRLSILRTLREEPRSKRDLVESETLPSRATVHRSVAVLETRGWVTQTADGKLRLTEAGVKALTEFDILVVSVNETVEKTPFLRNLDGGVDLPLTALRDVDLVVECGDDPFALLEASVEAADIWGDGVGHIRSLVPFFSPVLFEEFKSLANRETTFEVIYTPRAFRRLTKPRYTQYLTASLLAPDVEVRVHPEEFTWGLGLYDETVMLAGSTESSERAGVVGRTTDLTAWANETFDDLWAESETPPARLKRWVGSLSSS
jgi:predicted transcriptional regulator